MIRLGGTKQNGFPSFRTKLLLAVMLVVSVISACTLYFAERSAATTVEQNLRQEFLAQINGLHDRHELRQAAILERCRVLARKSRIRAALEDGAMDLLYPSARDELRDVMENEASAPELDGLLRAKFYRFLDRNGRIIPAAGAKAVGALNDESETALALAGVPRKQQIGYVVANSASDAPLFEVFAMPIASSETAETIAALVLGYEATALAGKKPDPTIRSGIWLARKLYLSGLSSAEAASIVEQVGQAIKAGGVNENSFETTVAGAPHLLFYKLLNPESMYEPAYEVVAYPLTALEARRRQLRWQVLGTGAAVFFVGLLASNLIAGGFSKPVEKLVKDSVENREARQRAEAALETTQEELQRSARFSADASHQLKTPVTVLRLGLEEMLARHNLTSEQANEISALIHQTYRLNSVIEDLLLLSKMDAGRLQLDFAPVNLTALIEGWLDDLSALPDPHHLDVRSAVPADLWVFGEKRYTSLILQNLLENARKYNRKDGVISVTGLHEVDAVVVSIANTGVPISEVAREHIFERFHRGAVGENIPGHGLGLNLARELARLHRGELWLERSDAEWTEFRVRFQRAEKPKLVGRSA